MNLHAKIYLLALSLITAPALTLAMDCRLPFRQNQPIIPLVPEQISGAIISLPPVCNYTPDRASKADQLYRYFEAALNIDEREDWLPQYRDIFNEEIHSSDEISIFTPTAILLGKIRSAYKLESSAIARGVLSFFDECSCSRYDRIADPEMRGSLEKKLLNIANDHLDKKSTITYVSIGCRGLFPDLFLITKLLEQDFQSIRIVLIDNDADFSNMVDLLREENSLWGCANGDTYARLGKIIMHCPDKLASEACRLWGFVQWMTYLHKNRGRGSVQIVLYDNIENYKKDCLQGSISCADIMLITDLDISEPEQVIQPAYEQLLRPGGIIGILVDIVYEVNKQEATQQRLNLLIYTTDLDMFFNDHLSTHKSVKIMEEKDECVKLALIRRYVGIKPQEQPSVP